MTSADIAKTPFERAYRGILRALYEGRFVPGQRLVAPDLMRDFDVSRGTVREVLQRLAATGVVTIQPHKGAQIRRLSRSEVIGLLEVVEVLLGLAARGAASAVTAAGPRQALQSRYEAMTALSVEVDFQRFIAAREDYYRCLVSASGNAELKRGFPNVQTQIMRFQLRPFDRAGDSADLTDYTRLHAAILSGDGEQAEAEGRAHVRKTACRIETLPDRAFS